MMHHNITTSFNGPSKNFFVSLETDGDGFLADGQSDLGFENKQSAIDFALSRSLPTWAKSITVSDGYGIEWETVNPNFMPRK